MHVSERALEAPENVEPVDLRLYNILPCDLTTRHSSSGPSLVQYLSMAARDPHRSIDTPDSDPRHANQEQPLSIDRRTNSKHIRFDLSSSCYDYHSEFSPNPTDESSIYDAARASSMIEEIPRNDDSDNQIHDDLDGNMAAHMAMLLHTTPDSTVTRSQHGYSTERRKKLPWYHANTLSGSHLPFGNDGVQAPASCPVDPVSKMDGPSALQRRKTVSMSDANDRSRKPNWPGRVASPVHPFLPKFPPPERSPTPPGLPSFGTREAILYSTQFIVRSSIPGETIQPCPRTSIDARSQRTRFSRVKYGDAVRRVLGLPPPPTLTSQPASLPTRPQVRSLARAEDGTAVQGRFPYRQSGHGMTMVSQLNDHPFHQRLPPAAQRDSLNTTVSAGFRDSQSTGEQITKEGFWTPAETPRRSGAQSMTEPHLHAPPERLGPNSTPARSFSAQALHPPAILFASPRRFSSYPHSPQLQQPMRIDSVTIPGISLTSDGIGLFPPPLESSMPTVTQSRVNTIEELSGIHEFKEFWTDLWKALQSYCGCCFLSKDELEDETDRGTSTETYATAQSCVVNNNSQEPSQVGSNEPHESARADDNEGHRRQRSKPWASLRGLISPANIAGDPMLV